MVQLERGRPKRASIRSDEERNKMVEKNLGLVHAYVNAFYKRYPDARVIYPKHEAESDARMGLIRACELFEEDKGFRLSTYAGHWARHYLMKSYRSCTVLPRPDKRRSDDVVSVYRLDSKMEEAFGYEDDREERVRRREIREAIEAAMRYLPSHYQQVIRLRLEGKTLKEVGAIVGVTREWVRQIEYRAHQKLFVRLLDIQDQF